MEGKKISRRRFIKMGACGLTALSLPNLLHAADTTGRGRARPNIIFLLTDDQRWDMMACAGNPIIHTPNMDELAHKGVRFTNAFVTTSICAASRAVIFTGLMERTHRFTFGTPPLPKKYTDISYPVLLRQAGYRTGFVGKYGVRVEKGIERQMFDYFQPLNRNPYFKRQPDGTVIHLTDITGTKAVEFIQTCRPDQPFCLSVSFNAPHAEDSDPKQYIWPLSVDHLYRDVIIPEPKLAEAAFFDAQPDFLKNSLNRTRWHWRFDTPQKYQRMVKGYYRMISGVDSVIGRLMQELKKRQIEKNTVIILTGDNGYFLGERGYAGKWVPYEDSLRVPLIIYDPHDDTNIQGREPAQMALNIDIAPTILDLADISVPSLMQGASLVPFIKAKKTRWRKDFFFEHLFEHPQIPKCEGVRSENWKYIRYFQQQPVYEELYNLKQDELETRNLINEPSSTKVLNLLRRRCDELRDLYGGIYRPPERINKP